ncbi:glycoside hydrolase family 28 protein [Umbelopsis sp. PMI_123]|nr:glycoside hydrolase family 28 protein [Umbelopsis sp. PMI_123]
MKFHLNLFGVAVLVGLVVEALPQKGNTCTIQSHGNGQDDSQDILSAFKECQEDSTIVFQEGVTYSVQEILPLTGLKNVDVEMRGTIEFGVNLRYWFTHSMYQEFQNVSIAMMIGGDNINWDGFGTGVVNGNGEIYYENFGTVSQYWGRPVPFYLHQVKNSVFRNFKIYKSQYWSFVINSSENVVADNINIENVGDIAGTLGNTDGFDTLYSNNITITNSVVNNGDDCISIKPVSTNIYVQNITCYNSTGIAIGSLGQYPGKYDIAENVTFRDVKIYDGAGGAYLKTWLSLQAGIPPNGGGNGTGIIKNLLFENFEVSNTSTPVLITQCLSYFKPAPDCNQYPSDFLIQNVSWVNFTGTSRSNQTISLECSSKTPCQGIKLENINIKPIDGSDAVVQCTNAEGLDSNCKSTSS